MASKSNLVNLDALILREDFAYQSDENDELNKVREISVSNLSPGSLILPNLRKPDFQRETNHWSPEQVTSFLESFVNGDVVPSIILWQSSSYIYVIDGGHRLSAIRAWIENDYGDGPHSYSHFKHQISKQQRKSADKTRELVDNNVGSFAQLLHRNADRTLNAEERKGITKIITRAIEVQWIHGNAETAERSFFKINTQGTPLDDIEEDLLRNRNKPIAIASRAIIRAGTGHEYWSRFDEPIKRAIVEKSKHLHSILFEPELKTPIKNLDLPLGGSNGVRNALKILMDFISFTNRGQDLDLKPISKYEDDTDGSATVEVLKNAFKVANRLTGNDISSLGLHPAVYYYGPTGRHSNAMFLGMVSLFSRKLANNDKDYFRTFTNTRSELEKILVDKKELIATIINKKINRQRVAVFSDLIDQMVFEISLGIAITEESIVKFAKLDGKVFVGESADRSAKFDDDTKSKVFITRALQTAMKCELCGGYLDSEKSLSYDHLVSVNKGGLGNEDNCQLTHPYCNSIKGDS